MADGTIKAGPLLQTVNVAGTLPANASSVNLSAPTVSGYEFFCWVNSHSTGWVGTIYSANPIANPSAFWVVGGQTSSARDFSALALYIKK